MAPTKPPGEGAGQHLEGIYCLIMISYDSRADYLLINASFNPLHH
jgi:hypothetical protein